MNMKNKDILRKKQKKSRENGEIPGCFFTAAGEATYDRSIANFIKVMSKHV